MFFFFNDTATTEIYTLSLHDALPIFSQFFLAPAAPDPTRRHALGRLPTPPPLPENLLSDCTENCPLRPARDRKSTRLNSSHSQISYAVFCLKKKKTT